MNNTNWTVWIGGAEINEHHLTLQEAEHVQAVWLARGYDDVEIEEIN